MRIYFLDGNNVQELNDCFKTLYITIIAKFEDKINVYNKKVLELNKDTDYGILINELKDTLFDLKDPNFENFFLNLGTETLEQIRYASVSKHTDKCIIRAVFDILFKYCIDIEFKVTQLCCNNKDFKSLQLEILRDLRYKITIPITTPITIPITTSKLIRSPILIPIPIQNLKI